jgi:hypothetical protein
MNTNELLDKLWENTVECNHMPDYDHHKTADLLNISQTIDSLAQDGKVTDEEIQAMILVVGAIKRNNPGREDNAYNRIMYPNQIKR